MMLVYDGDIDDDDDDKSDDDDGDPDDNNDDGDCSPFQAWLVAPCRTVVDSHRAAPSQCF